MKTTTLFFGLVLVTVSVLGQVNPLKYPDLVRKADSLYTVQDSIKIQLLHFLKHLRQMVGKPHPKSITMLLARGLWLTIPTVPFIT